MTAKKKLARIRRRLKAPPPPMAIDAGVGESPVAETRPANFGLIYTHLQGGKIVMGVQGPSFTTFRNKGDAADWLRGLARSIETSWPSE
jgi:hypothetical protein